MSDQEEVHRLQNEIVGLEDYYEKKLEMELDSLHKNYRQKLDVARRGGNFVAFFVAIPAVLGYMSDFLGGWIFLIWIFCCFLHYKITEIDYR